MASLHELTVPMNQQTLKALQENPQRPLESLQGNILRGHGRDRAVHIFLRFKADRETEVRRWIKELAERITSAQRQIEETEQYRRDKTPGRMFMSFLLSAQGYAYLVPDPQDRRHFNDEAFLYGMRAAQHRLNDPPQETWEQGYQHDIHAMVLLADDDEPLLLLEACKLLHDVKTCAEICAVEHGRAMWSKQEYPVEHFGFVDGSSQPLFFQSDIARARRKRDGAQVWDPGAGPNLVLVPDPYGREGCDSGSYLVFRKLEQHVRGFKAYQHKLAHALGLTGEDVQRAGALIMGRFGDGTPVVLQPTAGRPTNNFTYDEDRHGQKCPLQAHIRKVNPRKAGIPRIVRRGITYGTREKGPQDNARLEELPVDGVGLLFMCYQRNIAQQFELLQSLWANDPRLPRGQEPGIDPIIGQPGGNGAGQYKWPARWNDSTRAASILQFSAFCDAQGR